MPDSSPVQMAPDQAGPLCLSYLTLAPAGSHLEVLLSLSLYPIPNLVSTVHSFTKRHRPPQPPLGELSLLHSLYLIVLAFVSLSH